MDKIDNEIIEILKKRFIENTNRHPNTIWEDVEKRLKANQEKLKVLQKMESSGGEPDIVEYKPDSNNLYFYDCSKESPTERRSLCYDNAALEARKKNKPQNSAEVIAKEIGIDILTEEHYENLQQYGEFDLKTSSWLKTPDNIRLKGGAIFGDYRYGKVFIYHNGADSYYAARGFRGLLKL